jgi:hypothetical protein
MKGMSQVYNLHPVRDVTERGVNRLLVEYVERFLLSKEGVSALVCCRGLR